MEILKLNYFFSDKKNYPTSKQTIINIISTGKKLSYIKFNR